MAGCAAERWSVPGTLVVGLVMVIAGASGVLVTAVAQLPVTAMVLSLLTLVSGVAVTTPPCTSLALQNYPDVAGSASSLLGLARLAFGAVTAPLVGLAGAQTAVPLGAVAVSAAVVALVGYVLVRRPPRPALARECRAPAGTDVAAALSPTRS